MLHQQSGKDFDLIKMRAQANSLANQLELREASLPDRNKILNDWYKSCMNEDGLVSRPDIARLFIRQGFARDFETALTTAEARLQSEIGTDQKIVTSQDFCKCFVRAIFKESLVSKLN